MLLFQALGVRTSPLGIGAASRRSGRIGGLIGRGRLQAGRRQLARGNVVTGTLARGLGKTLGFVGKSFGRLIPFIGPIVIGFQALNALFGGALMRGLKSGFRSLGEALNLVDTPAEKAAKAMDKLTESVFKNITATEFDPGNADKFFDELLKREAARTAKSRSGDKDATDDDALDAQFRALNRRFALGGELGGATKPRIEFNFGGGRTESFDVTEGNVKVDRNLFPGGLKDLPSFFGTVGNQDAIAREMRKEGGDVTRDSEKVIAEAIKQRFEKLDQVINDLIKEEGGAALVAVKRGGKELDTVLKKTN